MDASKKILITTVVIAIVGFLAAPPGPIGQAIWPEPKHDVVPEGGQIPLFMALGLFEAAAMGFGIGFWAFGRPWSRATFGDGSLSMAAHIAIGFLSANFWLHDNLHILNGMDLWGIAVIDGLFHVPLIMAGVVLTVACAGVMHGERGDGATRS